MITANMCLFLASALIGFLVLRYRIHVTVSYTEPGARAARKPKRRTSEPAVLSIDPGPEREIMAALVGLGCSKPKARAIAARVAPQGGDFDTMLRRAIQEAA